MEVYMKFTLPEERWDLECHLETWRTRAVLMDLREELRQKRKHLDDTSTTWEEAEKLFWDILDIHELLLD
jgi:hypothetical protein